MSTVDMTYDEFIKTVPNDNNYKDRQFTALHLKKGLLDVETQDFQDVGTYTSMEPVPEGAKVCFSKGSVIIPTELVSPDSNVKIFRTNKPMSSLEEEPPAENPFKGGRNRKSRRRSNKKKKSTRKRKH